MKRLEELHVGRAQLTNLLNPSETFDVNYSILFRLDFRNHRADSPHREFTSARVNYVQSVDGASIPTGEYLLERECEITKVSNMESWQVLKWSQG